MKEEWTNKLKDLLSGYEEDVPERLWLDIESTLADTGKATPHHVRMKRRAAIVRLVTAVTAAAAAVFLGYVLFADMPQHPVSDAPVASAVKHATPEAAGTSGMPQGTGMAAAVANVASGIRQAFVAVVDGDAVQDIPVADASVSAPAADSVTQRQEPPKTVTPPSATVTKRPAAPLRDTRDKPHVMPTRRHGNRFSMSLYAQNIPVSSSSSQMYSRPMMLSLPGGSGSGGGSADAPVNTGLPCIKSITDVTAKKHRFPVRGGVSLRYALTDRTGIETGVTYTRLTSHFTSGGVAHHNDTGQTLHYVGIPLNVSYTLWRNRRLETYLSVGGEVQKCVSGKSEAVSVSNGTVVASEESSIKDSRLQWSANAAAGIQLNIVPAVGIYAEPGLSWTPDNGSSVETIYKDKPLNVNIKLGVRVKIK